MENYSIFDIIGPTMIGPSSSHTAGAAKLAYICLKIFGRKVAKVSFYLHGSFAETYSGHGTDKALIAGICGMHPDDPQIPDSYNVARKLNIVVNFYKKDLGDVHPNTVKIIFEDSHGATQEMVGSSIGGGKAKIIEIDGMAVSISGAYATLIAQHIDRPGFVASITYILASNQINIAYMRLFRELKGQRAVIVIDTDDSIPKKVLAEIDALETLTKLTFFDSVR